MTCIPSGVVGNEVCVISSVFKVTCRRRCAYPSVPAVVFALIDLAPIPSVIRLAAALGLLAGVQEAAAAVHALERAGPAGGSCGSESHVELLGRLAHAVVSRVVLS